MVAVAAQIVNLPPQAVPVRLNLGEELAQALDLRLQYWDLRRFVGRGSRHVHGCAAIPGNVRPPPLGGRLAPSREAPIFGLAEHTSDMRSFARQG